MIHLVKLAVGIEDVGHLRRIQSQRLKDHGMVFHRTRMIPRRAEELCAGGSIYWVVKGSIVARQKVLAVHEDKEDDGRPFCLLELDAELVETMPQPKRPFQGWRYLKPEDAPADMAGGDIAEMPPEMLRELKELGLL
ncbi:DUF1489 family protein [Telmatospirillum sp. J64-1]|uniref:DUF1489 family protein n=1 Tax=Telmatospirillum sp. J64-1 TaxID=2502183 RepID=UPI00115F2144|nr:DUF1489 domain-containing protein [Telmatospirillum sp. J64-1]